MDYAKFEAQIKELGMKPNFLSKLMYGSVATLISDAEVVKAIAPITTSKGMGCIAVTNVNFYALEAKGMLANDKVVIDLSKVSGCKISGMAGNILTITEGTTKYEYKGVSRALTIMEAIKNKDDKSVEQATSEIPAATDPTEELRKYKKLLDDGIITQEDFDQKKKVLLGL